MVAAPQGEPPLTSLMSASSGQAWGSKCVQQEFYSSPLRKQLRARPTIAACLRWTTLLQPVAHLETLHVAIEGATNDGTPTPSCVGFRNVPAISLADHDFESSYRGFITLSMSHPMPEIRPNQPQDSPQHSPRSKCRKRG